MYIDKHASGHQFWTFFNKKARDDEEVEAPHKFKHFTTMPKQLYR